MARKNNRSARIHQNEQKISRVSPAIASLASLILPGSGQVLARATRRGVTLLLSFLTLAALQVWRMSLAARRESELGAIISKAFRLQPLLLVLAIALLILYIWIAVDAYRVAKRTPGNSLLVMLLILAMFFVYGWQIGEINPVTVITQADEAGPALARVLWPWQRAVTYPEEVVSTSEILMAPCGGDLPAEIGPSETGVDLAIEPRCGEPSTQEQPGTTFTVQGTGFIPAEPVEFWWQDPIGNEFRQRQAGDYLRVTPDAEGNFRVELIFPYRLLPPQLGEGPKPWELQARQVASVGKAQVSAELKLTIEKMVETIMIGMMATFFGILLAVPLSFIAARNLMGGTTIGMLIYTITRTIMNIIRSIEPLIWAIIAVIVVGLGPFAGILALTLHSVAALGKLYSEAVESIDPGPIEAIQATGANWFQMVMYAVVPQIIPPFVSFTIYRWDINIRMSTIIGFVGGGGIGFLLAQWIRLLDYQAAGIAVWFIAVTVAILDYVSAEIRARFI